MHSAESAGDFSELGLTLKILVAILNHKQLTTTTKMTLNSMDNLCIFFTIFHLCF